MSFFLTTLVLGLIASCCYGVTEAVFVSEDSMAFVTAVSVSLGNALLQIFACIKRCRDIKNSPWYVLVLFIPLVGLVYSLILLSKGSRYPD